MCTTESFQLLALIVVAFAAVIASAMPPDDGADDGADDAAATTVVSKDGTRIAFDRTGEGPVLVLVGGALSDRTPHGRLAALLAEQFTVLNYDRRGRGKSGDTEPYSVAREVEDLEALVDEAGGTAFLFGASSGAVLALEAATRLPRKVTKVALFEPPFIVDDSRPPVPADFLERARALLLEDRRGDVVESFMTEGVGVPAEMVAQMRKMEMWSGLEKLAHTLPYDGEIMGDTQSGQPLPEDRWAAERAPALVLSGSVSPPWMHAGARALADLLPHAQHRTLEGLDHSAAVMKPQELAPVLAEFFAD